MSLGDKTKCDLCAEYAKIDITALNEVLRHKVFELNSEIRSITTEIYSVLSKADAENEISKIVSYNGRKLKNLIKELTITAELSRTILNSGNREIVPVNLLENKD